jgi:hypothetical protein
VRPTALAAALLAALSSWPAGADPIAIEAVPVALDPVAPERDEIGRLRYRGGLELGSPDGRFGGFSALHVDPDGRRLVALSDKGRVLSARPVHDARGRLVDLRRAELRPLRGADGRALSKRRRDAEALAPDGQGGFYVAFEQDHRIWRYPAGRRPFESPPMTLPMPPGLNRAPANGGVEALAALGDGRLLALAERLIDGDRAAGWVGGASGWAPLAYRILGIFRPTAAARLPSGDVLVLERGFRLGVELSARLLRLDPSAATPGAVLVGEELAVIRWPKSVDNMEGLAARKGPAGETLIYLISDNNFSPLQRTLLLLFELAG